MTELMKQLKDNMDERCPQPPGPAEEQDLVAVKLDTRQEGDEIIIVIRDGVVVKFEHRKIALENGNV